MLGHKVHASAPVLWSIVFHAVVIAVALLLAKSYRTSAPYEVFLMCESTSTATGTVEQKTVSRRSAHPEKMTRTSVAGLALEPVESAVSTQTSPSAYNAEKQPEVATASVVNVSATDAHGGHQISERPGNDSPVMVADFGSAAGPGFVYRAAPIYPAMARRLSREGKVVLRLHLDEYGNVQQIDVVQDPGCGFAEAAIEGVRKSKFRPAKREGRNVPVIGLLPIKFVLDSRSER
ncbi:MAG TPA: energy transducer TonB [Dissulfurispiraceae bacterium]|nr:energy transducer TonB [Dissulfurispiraceae bacterium]